MTCTEAEEFLIKQGWQHREWYGHHDWWVVGLPGAVNWATAIAFYGIKAEYTE